MSVFLSTTHLNRFPHIIRTSGFLQNPLTILSSPRWISRISASVDSNSNSFVVSYLVKSCGLSPEFALSASKHVDFKTSDKPDAVLSLLHNHLGLSKPQVSKVVQRYPRILLSNPNESISPKLHFLRSKGASIPQTAKLVLVCPRLVCCSLSNLIIPNFNFLRCFLQSDQDVVTSLVRAPFILYRNIATTTTPKINFLRDNGVPESVIAKMIKYHPGTLFRMNLDKLKMVVEEAKEIGIDPSNSYVFFNAVKTLAGNSKSAWKRKLDVFKSWGLSEGEVLTAFRRQPMIMSASVEKIMGVMDLFVQKLGWEPSIILKHPVFFGYSLKGRLIPRALVLQFLLSKRLIKNDFSSTFFHVTDGVFMKKFANYYKEAPEIVKVYDCKLDVP